MPDTTTPVSPVTTPTVNTQPITSPKTIPPTYSFPNRVKPTEDPEVHQTNWVPWIVGGVFVVVVALMIIFGR